jgi:hypothetical protein
MELQPLYLSILAGIFEADKLDTITLDRGNGASTLYLARKGTTVPEAIVDVAFTDFSVALRITTRNQRTKAYSVSYAEGIDGILSDLQRFLRADRLAAPVKAAA